jgi:hypothetical protein
MENKTKTKKSKSVPEENVDKTQFYPGDIWSLLYPVVEHWQSDLRFFEDELNFFRLLIDKHLSFLIEEKNIAQTRSMVADVTNLEKERTQLAERLASHAEYMASLVKNPFVQNAQECKDEHVRLESEFAFFVKKFRKVKSEVFKLTERVIHSDKVKKMIDWA